MGSDWDTIIGKWSGEDTKYTGLVLLCIYNFYPVESVSRTLRICTKFIGYTGAVVEKVLWW